MCRWWSTRGRHTARGEGRRSETGRTSCRTPSSLPILGKTSFPLVSPLSEPVGPITSSVTNLGRGSENGCRDGCLPRRRGTVTFSCGLVLTLWGIVAGSVDEITIESLPSLLGIGVSFDTRLERSWVRTLSRSLFPPGTPVCREVGGFFFLLGVHSGLGSGRSTSGVRGYTHRHRLVPSVAGRRAPTVRVPRRTRLSLPDVSTVRGSSPGGPNKTPGRFPVWCRPPVQSRSPDRGRSLSVVDGSTSETFPVEGLWTCTGPQSPCTPRNTLRGLEVKRGWSRVSTTPTTGKRTRGHGLRATLDLTETFIVGDRSELRTVCVLPRRRPWIRLRRNEEGTFPWSFRPEPSLIPTSYLGVRTRATCKTPVGGTAGSCVETGGRVLGDSGLALGTAGGSPPPRGVPGPRSLLRSRESRLWVAH